MIFQSLHSGSSNQVGRVPCFHYRSVFEISFSTTSLVPVLELSGVFLEGRRHVQTPTVLSEGQEPTVMLSPE